MEVWEGFPEGLQSPWKIYGAGEHIKELVWDRSMIRGTGTVPQEKKKTCNGSGQKKRTHMGEEDSDKEEGGTALTNWLELECRRGDKEKPRCGKAGPTIQHKPSHPHLREKTGRDRVGKGGSRDPVWEPRDLTGNLLDLLEQPHSG